MEYQAELVENISNIKRNETLWGKKKATTKSHHKPNVRIKPFPFKMIKLLYKHLKSQIIVLVK